MAMTMASLARAAAFAALVAMVAGNEIDCSDNGDGSCSADRTTLLQAKVDIAAKTFTMGDKGQCETYENTEKLCKDGSTCCKGHGCGGFGAGEEWKSHKQCYPCDWKDFGTTYTSDSCGKVAPTLPPTLPPTLAPTLPPTPAALATIPVVWQVIKTKTGKGDMSAGEINKLMEDVNKRFTGVDVDSWTPPKPGSIPGPDVTGILANKSEAACGDRCNIALCYKKGTASTAATKNKVKGECYCGDDFCKLSGWKYDDEKAMEKPRMNKLAGKRLDTGIRFKVDSIKYVTNDDWHFHCCCTHASFKYKIAQQEIFDQLIDKTTVRSKATVIVCDMQTRGGGTAGQASISGESFCAGGPGVMVDRNSMKPNRHGSNADTLVHELGHFLGLHHTFTEACPSRKWGQCKPEDKCNPAVNKGDNIHDTPVMIKQGACIIDASGETSDSCPSIPGKDPVDNFMSYSDCPLLRFTQGQVARMRGTIENYFPAFLTKNDGRVAKDLPCDPQFPSKKIPKGYKPAPEPTVAPIPGGGGGGGGGTGGGGDGIKWCSSLEADQCAKSDTGCFCADATNCCKGFGCGTWKATGGNGACLPCNWADGGASLLFTTDSCKTK